MILILILILFYISTGPIKEGLLGAEEEETVVNPDNDNLKYCAEGCSFDIKDGDDIEYSFGNVNKVIPSRVGKYKAFYENVYNVINYCKSDSTCYYNIQTTLKDKDTIDTGSSFESYWDYVCDKEKQDSLDIHKINRHLKSDDKYGWVDSASITDGNRREASKTFFDYPLMVGNSNKMISEPSKCKCLAKFMKDAADPGDIDPGSADAYIATNCTE